MLYEIILSMFINHPEHRCVRWAWRDDGTSRYVWCLKWEKVEKQKKP
jgi:hypothetical protein